MKAFVLNQIGLGILTLFFLFEAYKEKKGKFSKTEKCLFCDGKNDEGFCEKCDMPFISNQKD